MSRFLFATHTLLDNPLHSAKSLVLGFGQWPQFFERSEDLLGPGFTILEMIHYQAFVASSSQS